RPTTTAACTSAVIGRAREAGTTTTTAGIVSGSAIGARFDARRGASGTKIASNQRNRWTGESCAPQLVIVRKNASGPTKLRVGKSVPGRTGRRRRAVIHHEQAA